MNYTGIDPTKMSDVERKVLTIRSYRDCADRALSECNEYRKEMFRAEQSLADICAAMRCEDCPRKGYEPYSTRVCEFFGSKSDRLYALYADKQSEERCGKWEREELAGTTVYKCSLCGQYECLPVGICRCGAKMNEEKSAETGGTEE